MLSSFLILTFPFNCPICSILCTKLNQGISLILCYFLQEHTSNQYLPWFYFTLTSVMICNGIPKSDPWSLVCSHTWDIPYPLQFHASTYAKVSRLEIWFEWVRLGSSYMGSTSWIFLRLCISINHQSNPVEPLFDFPQTLTLIICSSFLIKSIFYLSITFTS